MKVRQNLHIHSQHSCDSACARLNDINTEMNRLGMSYFGVSDHFHTQYNMCDLESSRNDFLVTPKEENFHFGVEVSCVGKWECERIAAGDYGKIGDDPVYGLRFSDPPVDDPEPAIDLSADDIRRLGIEYVIAGVHWPLNRLRKREDMFKDFFDQQMFLIRDPRVDILAHPWDAINVAASGWFADRSRKYEADAYLDVPQQMNEQLMKALIKYNKCAEINMSGIFRLTEKSSKWYWNMLAAWREEGVKFTIGSDQHSEHSCRTCFGALGQLLDCYGFTENDIVYPCRKEC